MRAREPDVSGFVERDGVRVAWERFGSGEPALLFLGVDPDRRIAQVEGPGPVVRSPPHRRHVRSPGQRSQHAHLGSGGVHGRRVRGLRHRCARRGRRRAGRRRRGVPGRRGRRRPGGAARGSRRAASSRSTPGMPLSPLHAFRRPRGLQGFDDVLDSDEGWCKENRHYWLRDWPGYCAFFFDQLLPEPHSTKPVEDCVGWGLRDDARDHARLPGRQCDQSEGRPGDGRRVVPAGAQPGARDLR